MVNYVATTHPLGQKRCRSGDACQIISCFIFINRKTKVFEVEDFVRSTRRWFDRGNPRDAGELDACQTISFN